MRAVLCRDADLRVEKIPTPVPGRGQLLVQVLRCGICGSDLHARVHCDELAGVVAEVGYDDFMRSSQDVVLGHEFCGEVVGRGAGSRTKEGTHVVALPLLRAGGKGGPLQTTGLSARAPGAYAEHLLVEESLTLPVPNGLAPDSSVLTEPMAVGLHAVRRGEVRKGQVAIVMGCGPVGLSVIALLKAQGVRHVIASDPSAGRRALARACGADVVVDPVQESPYASAREHGHLVTGPQAFELGVSTIEKLTRLRLPWWHVWRAADAVGAATPKAPVVFECVGVPGMIDGVIAGAPLYSRVVVVGVCMGADRLRPALAINKEVELRFVLGYTPREFRETLHLLAEGILDVSAMVTGTVGLDGVAEAFEALGSADRHAKVLIDPRRTGPAAL